MNHMYSYLCDRTLVDVDDTLLENDRIQDDLKRHIEQEFGAECRDRFWAIQEDLLAKIERCRQRLEEISPGCTKPKSGLKKAA